MMLAIETPVVSRLGESLQTSTAPFFLRRN